MIGVIYKIYCKDSNITDCYIGSTKNLNNRKSQHKCYCNNKNQRKYNYNIYNFIRNNGGYNNFDYEILEEIYNGDLKQYEREYIEKLKPTLNKLLPNRTGKEAVKFRNKNFRDNNKDRLNKERREKIKCDCGILLNKNSIYKHKKSKKHLNKIR